MPYSELKPGRLRLEDESTGTAYLFIQKDDNLLWCDVSENILQVITNVKFGAKADRPTAGKKGLLYFATDTKEFFYDNGSAWVRVVSGETGLYDADRDTYLNVEPSSDADKIICYTAGTQVLNISSAGILTFPKQSFCHMYQSTQQTIQTDTDTKVALDTKATDIQNEGDTTNYRITVNESGVYLIVGQVGWYAADVVADNVVATSIRVNGNITAWKDLHISKSGSGIDNSVALIKQLSAGDYVELYAKQYSGSDMRTNATITHTFLCVAKIA